MPAGAPFATLADEAAGWARSLEARWDAAGRPCDRRRVDGALAAIRELSGSQPEPVLLHQDLHGDNVLSSERGWLAIDPKPLVGERAFGVAPIVRSSELGHSRREVRWRLDRLTAELGLDRERARGWTLAQTLAWGFDADTLGTHLEVVEWLA